MHMVHDMAGILAKGRSRSTSLCGHRSGDLQIEEHHEPVQVGDAEEEAEVEPTLPEAWQGGGSILEGTDSNFA